MGIRAPTAGLRIPDECDDAVSDAVVYCTGGKVVWGSIPPPATSQLPSLLIRGSVSAAETLSRIL